MPVYGYTRGYAVTAEDESLRTYPRRIRVMKPERTLCFDTLNYFVYKKLFSRTEVGGLLQRVCTYTHMQNLHISIEPYTSILE